MKQLYLIVIICLKYSSAISSSWRPVLGHSIFSSSHNTQSFPSFGEASLNYQGSSSYPGSGYEQEVYSGIGHGAADQCAADKFAFEQDAYIRYETKIPSLKEFTLCLWANFYNHSTDHPLFSYSAHGEPRELALWVSNAREASYFSMAVHGQTLYRLNYPVKLGQWHHVCSSWNGRTGEWQVWVGAERVGRGFNNRLVGHVIHGGGVAISGQDQAPPATAQISGHPVGGPLNNGYNQAPASLAGELTMVQLYRVALSAGKAHRDHKHHHVHHFKHDGGTTPAPPTLAPPVPQQPLNPLLNNGQIPPSVRLNFGGQIPQSLAPQIVPIQLPNGQNINQQFLNGQFVNGRLLSEQLLAGGRGLSLPQAAPSSIPLQQFTLQYAEQAPQSSAPTATSFGGSLVNSGLVHQSLTNPANVQFIDTTSSSNHFLFKRQENGEKTVVKRQAGDDQAEDDSKKHSKRGLIELSDGTLVDDSGLLNIGEQGLVPQDIATDVDGVGLAQFGLHFAQQPKIISQGSQLQGNGNISEDEIKEYDREPAEAEVKEVLNLCDACGQEPFEKALALGWSKVKKSSYNALRAPARGVCGAFR